MIRDVVAACTVLVLLLSVGQSFAQAPLVGPAEDAGDVLPFDDHEVAVLGALDKITARTSVMEVALKQPLSFGTLSITVHACRKTPPEERPEAAAFLEIDQEDPDRPREVLFRGWMFASSPAISALEDPVYDIWLVDCKIASTASGPALE